MERSIPAAALVLSAWLVGAQAGPVEVAWPANYAQNYTQYFEGDRTANDKQVIRIYANDTALKGARADGQLPYGSVLVGELYSVKLDAQGRPLISALGRRVIDRPAAVVVMERRQGVDAAYPDALKVGDWAFAVFGATGQRLDKDVTPCRACHQPHADRQFVFSYQHLAR